MKQRVLALLMAMALCLSLVPVATAEPGSGPPATGLHAAGSGENVIGDLIPMTQVDGQQSRYLVNYASGQEFQGATYYYIDISHPFANGYNLGTGREDVTVHRMNEDNLCIQILPGCVGDGFFGILVNNNLFPFYFHDTNAPTVSFYKGPDQIAGSSGVITAACQDDGTLSGTLMPGSGWTFAAPDGPLNSGRITVSYENETQLSVTCAEGDQDTDQFFYFRFNTAQKTLTFCGFTQPESGPFVLLQIRFVLPGSGGNGGGNSGSDPVLALFAYDGAHYEPLSKYPNGSVLVSCGTDGARAGLRLGAEGWKINALNNAVHGQNGRVAVSDGLLTDGKAYYLSVDCAAGSQDFDLTFFLRFDTAHKTMTFTGFTAPESGPYVSLQVRFSAAPAIDGYVPAENYAVGSTPFDTPIGPIPFEYTVGDDVRTYYVGVAWVDNHNGKPAMQDSYNIKDGLKVQCKYGVGFWTGQMTGQVMTYYNVDDSTYDTLYAQFEFDDQSMALLRRSDNSSQAPAVYRPASGVGIAMNMTSANVGKWIPRLTGTLKSTVKLVGSDANTFTAYGETECTRLDIAKWAAPDEVQSLSDEVYAFFKAAVDEAIAHPDPSHTGKIVFEYTIPYKDGGYNDYIVLPDVSGNFRFDIRGASGPHGERLVIHGSLLAQSCKTRLYDLAFVSSGDRNDPENVCCTGMGEVEGERCTFSGYYRAMESIGQMHVKWGFTSCRFENNTYCIYMDVYGDGGGNIEMFYNTFENNHIPLHFAHFSDTTGTHNYLIQKCKFINNDCDLLNTSGRAFFMPKNYFVHNGQRGSLKLCPNSTAPASSYPSAMDENFTEFDYVSEQNPLLSAKLNYTIPFEALTGDRQFSVLDEDSDFRFFYSCYWIFKDPTP